MRALDPRSRRLPAVLLVLLAVVAASGVLPAARAMTVVAELPDVASIAASAPRGPRSAPLGPAPSTAPSAERVTTASAIQPGSVNRTSLRVAATYDVRVRIAVGARAVRGRATIVATNRSGGGIDRLELNTVMAPLGGLRLGTVTVDGDTVRPDIDGQTVVVPLGGVLPDGATATLVVPFSATLRSSVSGSSWLFTRANGIVDMHRWIPWVSRKRRFDRPNHGDPFVTPVSPRVTVRIHTDRPMRLATTGERIAISDDGLTRTYRATNVRDFVVTAAADYRTRTATVGDTSVRVSSRPGFPARATLRAAKAALSKLEAKLGAYPYQMLRVAQSAGAYGMEGPGIAWIPTGTPSGNLRYLVTHEIAHQWFYGIVGNDQAREPFADEAAADFAARRVLDLRRGSRCAKDDLDRSIYRYSSTCYYEVVYIQGGNLLDNARLKIGPSTFWPALRRYIRDHRWGLSHTRTLLDALDAATPLDLRSWWRSRFPSLY